YSVSIGRAGHLAETHEDKSTVRGKRRTGDCGRRGLCTQSRKQKSRVAESGEEPETRQTGYFGEELSKSRRSSPQAVSRPAGGGVGAEIASSTRLESQSVAAEN